MAFTKLKTDINGGFPLVLDDLRILQGELGTYFNEFLENALPADSAIWINGGNYPNSLSIGIGGGVAYVKGVGLVNVDTNNLAGWSGITTFLRPAASTFNAAGLKTFQNGTSNNTYELPKYTITTGTAAAGDIILNNWYYLSQIFGKDIVIFESGISVFSGFFNIIADRNRVTIRCAISGPAGTRTSDETLFTLNNTLFDPAFAAAMTLAQGASTGQAIPIGILSSGEVVARFSAANGEYPISFELTYTL